MQLVPHTTVSPSSTCPRPPSRRRRSFPTPPCRRRRTCPRRPSRLRSRRSPSQVPGLIALATAAVLPQTTLRGDAGPRPRAGDACRTSSSRTATPHSTGAPVVGQPAAPDHVRRPRIRVGRNAAALDKVDCPRSPGGSSPSWPDTRRSPARRGTSPAPRRPGRSGSPRPASGRRAWECTSAVYCRIALIRVRRQLRVRLEHQRDGAGHDRRRHARAAQAQIREGYWYGRCHSTGMGVPHR